MAVIYANYIIDMQPKLPARRVNIKYNLNNFYSEGNAIYQIMDDGTIVTVCILQDNQFCFEPTRELRLYDLRHIVDLLVLKASRQY